MSKPTSLPLPNRAVEKPEDRVPAVRKFLTSDELRRGQVAAPFRDQFINGLMAKRVTRSLEGQLAMVGEHTAKEIKKQFPLVWPQRIMDQYNVSAHESTAKY